MKRKRIPTALQGSLTASSKVAAQAPIWQGDATSDNQKEWRKIREGGATGNIMKRKSHSNAEREGLIDKETKKEYIETLPFLATSISSSVQREVSPVSPAKLQRKKTRPRQH